MTSLRRRLLAWLLISTAALGTLALLDTRREARATATAASDRVLAGAAMAIAERVTPAEDGGLEVDVPYGALEMLSSPAQDAVFYRVDGPEGFLTGYAELPVQPAREGGDPGYGTAPFRGAEVRIATLARAASTGIASVPFRVTVAETTEARGDLTRAILLRTALRLALMIVTAAAIAGVAVTLSLRPLLRLSDAIAARSPDDLSPIEARVPRELSGLVEVLNSFMARLAGTLAALRNFTGNAGHQVRTPLAVIGTQLALAERAATLDQAQAAAGRAQQALGDARRVLAQLLLLARVDAAEGEALALAPLDLAAFARDLTAEMVPGAAAAGVDLGYDGAGAAMVRAEPLLLRELLRNLIENAVAYAGRGAEVTVRVRPAPGAVLLEVEDDGPGIPPERRAAMLRRFSRGRAEEATGKEAVMAEGERRFARGRAEEGLGLGLPVVEEIAAFMGAGVELTDGAGPGPGRPGLCVRIAFPA